MQATHAPMNALGWPIQTAVVDATLEKKPRMRAETLLQRLGSPFRVLGLQAVSKSLRGEIARRVAREAQRLRDRRPQ